MAGRQPKAYRSKELIEEIRKRPRLWSPVYKYCSDKETRDANWMEVAQTLLPNFELMSSSKKNEKITLLKKRWKNIRDHYIKESKRRKSAKCIYKDALNFLNQVPSINMVSIPQTSAATDRPDNEAPQKTDQAPIEVDSNSVSLKIIKVEEGSDHTAGEPLDELLTHEVDTSSTSRPEQFEGSIDFEPQLLCENEEHIDEDKSFLLSLLSEMRKLNGLQKIDFKIAVLNDLRMARYTGNQGEK